MFCKGKGTKKIVCPDKKCKTNGYRTKLEIKMGSRDNGDIWEEKERTCPNCRRLIRFRVNNHRGKVVLMR